MLIKKSIGSSLINDRIDINSVDALFPNILRKVVQTEVLKARPGWARWLWVGRQGITHTKDGLSLDLQEIVFIDIFS